MTCVANGSDALRVSSIGKAARPNPGLNGTWLKVNNCLASLAPCTWPQQAHTCARACLSVHMAEAPWDEQ